MAGLPATLVRDITQLLAGGYKGAIADADETQLANSVAAAIADVTERACLVQLRTADGGVVEAEFGGSDATSGAPSVRVDVPGLDGPIGGIAVDLDGGGSHDETETIATIAQLLGLAVEAVRECRTFDRTAAYADERLHLLMDETPLGLAFVDERLRVIEINEALARDYARTVDDCIGRSVAELVPDLWPKVEPALQSVFRTGEPVLGYEISGMVPSEIGVERHRMVTYYPVRDSGGAVRSVGALVVDITERKRAERAARLVSRISELFATTADVATTLEAASRIAVPDFADAAIACLLTPEAQVEYLALARVDVDSGEVVMESPDRCPVDLAGGTPTGDQLARGEPVVVLDLDRAAAPVGFADLADELDATSVIVVPLGSRARISGAIAFVRTEHSHLRYRQDDVDLACQIGERLSQLVTNVQLAEVASRAQDRLQLLARASTVVESELDVEARAEAVVRVAVPDFADHASVFLFDPDRRVLRFAGGVHRDSAVNAEMHQVEWPDLELDSPLAPALAVRTGLPVLRPFQPTDGPARLVASTRPELAASLATRSVLAVPLRQDDEILGALFFATVRAGRRYGEDDLPLVSELARIAAPAIQNALRYQQERLTAETLQRSLLPQDLPDTGGVWLAARYLPGTTGLQVGGDWHDVITRDDRVILAIGDVVGHSIEAAVSMGRFRTVLKFAARQSGDPSRILRRINEFMCDAFPGDMATLLVVAYDPFTGTAHIASGGHLSPVLRTPSGEIALVDIPPGLPLCIDDETSFVTTAIRIEAGSALVLYTDGLVERRGEVLDVGLARLLRAVASGDNEPEDLATRIVTDLVADGAEDDVAVLVGRFTVAGERLAIEFTASADRLSALRRDLRLWLTNIGVPTDMASDVILAVNEAVANAIEHGYAGAAPGKVKVDGRRDGDAIEIVISDQGVWREASEDVTRGRGFPIIRGLMDDVVVDTDQGVRLTLRKRLADGTVIQSAEE